MKKIKEFLKMYVFHFGNDNLMINASAIAFYTLFSMPSMVMIIIFIIDFWFADGSGSKQFYGFLSDYLGKESVSDIKSTVENSKLESQGWFETIVGFIVLIISSTSLLGAIHEAFNKIWGVETSVKYGFLNVLVTRLISFGMLIIMAFIVAASLLLDAVINNFGDNVNFPLLDTKPVLFIFNESLSVILLTCLFAAIFKILPDTKIRFKNIWLGSLITAILFTIGKFGIGYYLSMSSISDTYGAAGSLVIILIWVYYLTIILLIGAEFTKVLTLFRGNDIIPKSYAMLVSKTVDSINPDDKKATDSPLPDS